MTGAVARSASVTAAFAWALFILVLLMMPGTSVPSMPQWVSGLPVDKFVHAFLFFVQAALLHLAARSSTDRREVPQRTVALLCIATALYGGLTELLQLLANSRSADVVDFLFDSGGVALFALWMLLHRRRADGTGATVPDDHAARSGEQRMQEHHETHE